MASLLAVCPSLAGFLGPWLVGPIGPVMKLPFPNYLINGSS